MCVEQGQHIPRKDYPCHPLCHGFIRPVDDYSSVESCRSSSSLSPCRCGTGHATLPMFPAASVAVITASPAPTRKRLILGPRSSSSSSLPTNRIPGLAVGVILMISPSPSTFPPSVIVYALQMSLADTWKSPRLSLCFSSSRSSSWCHFLTRGTGTQDTVGAVVSLTVTLEVQERSEEHTSELQSRPHLVCRLLLEKKKRE